MLRQPKLALIGRPNVGKSTLFNRLVGKRLAIVHDQPGVTRDWRQAPASLGDLEFTVLDTAGYSPKQKEKTDAGSLTDLMNARALATLPEADILLFVIDGRAGVHPMERDIAEMLRQTGKPVCIIVNKSEGREAHLRAMDAYQLGLGDPIPISAEHGDGMIELYDALRPLIEIKMAATLPHEVEHEIEAEQAQSEPLKLAIVGRPNVGKSTLVNRLAGDDRVLTGAMAGLTRDAIYVDVSYQGQALRVVDTAGLRRRSKVVDALERASINSTRQAIELAELVILVLSAEEGIEKQDLQIAGQVIEEGRALMLAVNKSDLVEDRAKLIGAVQDRLAHSLPQARDVPVMAISAEFDKGLPPLIKTAFSQRELWNSRLPTAKLNNWLQDMIMRHPPPALQGRRPKPRYLSQIKTRPPTFALFGTRVDLLPDHWQRYLVNRLRQDFNLPGVPIRLLLRSASNPYHQKQK